MRSNPCSVCEEPIELDDDEFLTVRHAEPADSAALRGLYAQLSPDDLLRRFFHSGPAPEAFLERWAALESNGGCCLLVESHRGDTVELVAEAGYSMLSDGDGELAMAVAPGHRGWLGAWLLDLLLRHANDRGVENIQAIIKTSNRGMLGLAKHRGCAFLDHPDWDTVHVTISSDGHVPSWPPDDERPRLLVESDRSRWASEEAVRQLGATVITCNGMGHDPEGCPLLNDERCPLVEGADAVVVDLPEEHPWRQPLLDAESEVASDVTIVSESRPVGGQLDHRARRAELVERIRVALGLEKP